MSEYPQEKTQEYYFHEVKQLTIERVISDINLYGHFKCSFGYGEQYYKFTAHGLKNLRFFLNNIKNKPDITLQELRTLFNNSRNQTADFEEAACIDFLVHKFTGKFGCGGGLWCSAYNLPTIEDQLLQVYEVVNSVDYICDESMYCPALNLSPIMYYTQEDSWNYPQQDVMSQEVCRELVQSTVGKYAFNIGIFTFSCMDKILQ